jgi:hypothetical protein
VVSIVILHALPAAHRAVAIPITVAIDAAFIEASPPPIVSDDGINSGMNPV